MFKHLLQKLSGKSETTRSRRQNSRGLRLEKLDKRSMLAADIGEITGTTYIDLNGNGLDVGDTRLGGVEVRLFRDGGDGVFGGDDTLAQTTDSNDTAGPTLGRFTFSNLVDGLYFVEQVDSTAPAGLNFPDPVPVTINNRVLLIDNYSTGNQTASITTGGAVNQVDTDSIAATSAVGGGRDIRVTRTGGTNPASVQVDTTQGELSFSSGAGTDAVGLVQYDGNDGTIVLNATGLRDATGTQGVSLAGGLPGEAPVAGSALMLAARTNVIGSQLTVRIYTDSTNFSTFTQAITVGANFSDTTALFLSDFTIGGGTGADFNDVGAIEVEVTLADGADSFVNLVESVRPDLQTVNLTNIQPLTIGNLIFQDNNNDGLFNTGDVGLSGVDVELYELAALGDTVNPATQTPVATVTSGAGGAYSFNNVNPGIYALVIPSREFDVSSNAAGARTLVGFSPSSAATAGANANVDNDNDGRAVTGQLYVASGAFELISGSEPSNGGNTNNTLDFGFASNTDLQVTKTFVSLDTAGDGSRTATFRIDVLNNGPVNATGVTVIDTLPTGLTFNRVTSTTSTTAAPAGVTGTSVTGNAVNIDLVDLTSSGGTSFHIIVNVAANAFGDLTNSVTVSGDQNDPVVGNNTDDALLELPQTDLSIVKTLETTAGATIPPATARTGDTVVYRLVVSNAGPDNATGVSVVDQLPVGVTFVSGTINGGTAGTGITFDSTTRRVTAAVGALSTTTPAVILLTVTINSDAADLLTNTATVSNTPNTDNNPNNNEDSVDNSVTRAVDLAVTKAISTAAADNTTAAFGAPITFVITVTNTTTSPGASRGFTVTDTLPAGLTFVAGSFDAGTSGVTVANNGQDLTFTGGALAIGASVSFTFDALIAQSAGTTITNTATVAPINAGGVVDVDINSANNTGSEALTPARNIELVVTKDDNFTGTATATPGGNIVYTIVVSNNGVSNAVNVNVLDTLPAGVTATAITSGGSQITDNNPDAGLLGFVLPLVTAGGSVTVEVTASIAPTATGSITNTVAVSGGGANDLPAGNTATVTTPLAPVVDVQVVKTGPATAVPGGASIAYNLAIQNSGPSVATNVNVTDDLPAGVTIQSVTLNGTPVANTGTGGDVAFVIPTLGVGAANAATVVITVAIDPAATGSLSNTATVSATGDTTPANNTSTISTALTPTADVTVTKTVNNATAASGESLTYTIQVRNGGVSTAAGVTLVDVLPTGLTFTSGTGPNNQVLTATGQTVNVNVGTLAPNATANYTIIAAIGSTFTGQLVNPVTVATTTPEGANALPNTASATTTVQIPDPNTALISGRVFLDANRDGRFTVGELGIPDVTIRLRNTGSTTVQQTTTTNADGTYSFTGLAAGSYDVEQVQPAGVRDGLEQAGPNATPTEIADGIFRAIALAPAGQAVGFNYAELELLSKRRFLASTPN